MSADLLEYCCVSRSKRQRARHRQGRQTDQHTRESPRTNTKLPPTNATKKSSNIDCDFRISMQQRTRRSAAEFPQRATYDPTTKQLCMHTPHSHGTNATGNLLAGHRS